MKIGIVGAGYVGLVTGVCLAKMGHHVCCVDSNGNKIDLIKNKISPIYEPGLGEMLEEVIGAGYFQPMTSMRIMISSSDVIFVCVGTPMMEDGSADLSYVFDVAVEISKQDLSMDKVICIKSTVPPKTTEEFGRLVRDGIEEKKNIDNIHMAMCPEFLKEGSAVNDFMKPDRIVIGVEDSVAAMMMKKVFEQFVKNDNPMLITDIVTAELTKYAANCMLASRISLMNELSRVATKIGADIDYVRKGISYDSRIGRKFLYAGPGYGGSCFPKDVRAISNFCKEIREEVTLLPAIDKANSMQKYFFEKLVVEEIRKPREKVAIWGLAFKANTDDIRESPAIDLMRMLRGKAEIYAHDPKAVDNAMSEFAEEPNVSFGMIYGVVQDARILVIATEWDVYRYPDFGFLKTTMAEDPVIVDGRNLYDRAEVESHGIKYIGIGR